LYNLEDLVNDFNMICERFNPSNVRILPPLSWRDELHSILQNIGKKAIL